MCHAVLTCSPSSIAIYRRCLSMVTTDKCGLRAPVTEGGVQQLILPDRYQAIAIITLRTGIIAKTIPLLHSFDVSEPPHSLCSDWRWLLKLSSQLDQWQGCAHIPRVCQDIFIPRGFNWATIPSNDEILHWSRTLMQSGIGQRRNTPLLFGSRYVG